MPFVRKRKERKLGCSIKKTILAACLMVIVGSTFYTYSDMKEVERTNTSKQHTTKTSSEGETTPPIDSSSQMHESTQTHTQHKDSTPDRGSSETNAPIKSANADRGSSGTNTQVKNTKTVDRIVPSFM
jgi:hypothetical protein